MTPADVPAAVRAAAARIAPHVRETPLWPSPALSRRTGTEVHLKLESLQVTASFKARGAVNKVLSLSPAERAAGVVTASSGNHGAATAYALARTGARGLVFVPESTPEVKRAAIRDLGADLRVEGRDGLYAELAARAHAERTGMTYVSPYNDPEVVAGQGTIGLELARQLPDLDEAVVAVGGGGLVSGIAGYLKSVRPGVRVLGCQPEVDQAMHKSVRAGRIVEDEAARPTLSDGTSGGIEPGSLTFALCRDLIDDWALVPESAIAAAMRNYVAEESQLLEGAAGAAIAGLVARAAADPGRYRGRKVVVIVCGARIGPDKLAAVLAGG